jgi:hypothetical protein
LKHLQKALAMATLATRPTRGTRNIPVFRWDTMSRSPRSVPLMLMWVGGNARLGNPDSMFPEKKKENRFRLNPVLEGG